MVREKTRHLLLELIWKDEHREHGMTKEDFGKLLHKALRRLYGPLGTAEFPQNLTVRYFDGSTNLCILRCNREQKTQVCFQNSFKLLCIIHRLPDHFLTQVREVWLPENAPPPPPSPPPPAQRFVSKDCVWRLNKLPTLFYPSPGESGHNEQGSFQAGSRLWQLP